MCVGPSKEEVSEWASTGHGGKLRMAEEQREACLPEATGPGAGTDVNGVLCQSLLRCPLDPGQRPSKGHDDR